MLKPEDPFCYWVDLQVLILGYGNIGKELAIRLRAFGVHILAVKRSWTGLISSNDIHSEKGTKFIRIGQHLHSKCASSLTYHCFP